MYEYIREGNILGKSNFKIMWGSELQQQTQRSVTQDHESNRIKTNKYGIICLLPSLFLTF